MKKSLRFLATVLPLTIFSLVANAQNIYQLIPLNTFGSHSDGSLRPGDNPPSSLGSQGLFDTGFNQRGMAYDPVLTNLVIVDTHSGSGGSTDVRGGIYVLDATYGTNQLDTFDNTLVLNTNSINGGSYADSGVVVADDGAVYVCNQVVNSGTQPILIYRYDSSRSADPPLLVFSNTIVPAQRYGSSIAIRGAGTNTQIMIGSFPNSTTGTNVVIFTTADGTNLTANVLGTDQVNPAFNDGIAFGPGNTFYAKRVGAPLLFMAFNLAGHSATTIRSFNPTTFPDNDNLSTLAVDVTNNLMAAIEQSGGNASGGADRVRLYDISNISNQPPVLLDAELFPVDFQNALAPLGYLNFGGGRLYAGNINNGLMAFNVALAPPPPPILTVIPAETNKTVVGRTVNLTVAGFPAVHYQWQSNGVDIASATSGTLTLVNVQTNFAALYTCVVTNSSGTTNASSRLEVVSSASFYHLNLQWYATPGDTHSYIQNGNGAAPGTPNARALAYNALSNHLYVITRSGFGNNPSFSNYDFNVVNASNGDLLWKMNTNGITLGVGNGGIGLSSVVCSDDGAIYACNIAVAAGGYINSIYDDTRIFRLYRWADGNSNTVPVQIYSGDPAINAGISGLTSTNRWGDSLAIRGSGLNTQIILDNNNANVRYVAILTPTDSTMTNWTTSGLHQTVTGTSIGRSLEFGSGGTTTSGTFWQKRNATALIQSPFDLLSPIDPVSPLVTTTAFTNALSGATIDSTRHLLIGVSIYANALITPDTVDLYEMSDLNSPILLDQKPFPINSFTNHAGALANAINKIIRSGDKVFAIEGGNGLLAMNIAPGPPTAPAFTRQPENVRVIQGGTITFSAAVDQQANFQWRFGGANIAGATAQTFVLNNAQLANAGQYRVTASNIFGVSTSAVAIASVYLPQDEYSLQPIWQTAPGTQPYLIGINGGSPNQRTIAYNALSNHLYVVARSSGSTSNYVIFALNASDGSIVSALNTNGIYNGGAVGEGGIGLVGIGVADDGAIYACNEAPDACGCGPTGTPDSLFRVYRWADGDTNTLPVQIFAGDPAGATSPIRWGDTLTVRGSGMSTEILLDSQLGNYAAILKPADPSMTTFTNAFMVVPSQNSPAFGSTIGRSLQFGSANTLWQKRMGTPFRLSSYDLAGHSSVTVTNLGNFTSTLGPVAQDFTRNLLVGIDFNGSGSTPDSLDLYDMSVPSAPLLIAQYSFPTNQQGNANFIGQALFAGNRVWALDGNNGLMAFTIGGPQLTITTVGSNLVESWTTNVGPLTLQATPSLASPSVWTNVGTGSVSGSRYSVTNPPAGGSLFYRLQK
jgi:hypothetical protein